MPTVTQIYFLQILLHLQGFAVPASDDSSSCAMVCATPTGGSDLKTKESGAAVCITNATECISFAFSPSLREQSLPPSAGERNLCPICLPSDELWLVTQPSIFRCHSGSTIQLAEDISLLSCPAHEISPFEMLMNWKINWFHFWSIHRDLKLDKVLSNINQGLGSTNMFEQRSWEMIL